MLGQKPTGRFREYRIIPGDRLTPLLSAPSQGAARPSAYPRTPTRVRWDSCAPVTPERMFSWTASCSGWTQWRWWGWQDTPWSTTRAGCSPSTSSATCRACAWWSCPAARFCPLWGWWCRICPFSLCGLVSRPSLASSHPSSTWWRTYWFAWPLSISTSWQSWGCLTQSGWSFERFTWGGGFCTVQNIVCQLSCVINFYTFTHLLLLIFFYND